MIKKIFKYKVTAQNPLKIDLPKGAEILCVQCQNDEPHLWAVVNPEEKNEERYFETFGTGDDMHYGMGVMRKYIGTFQIKKFSLVFHLFERLN